MAIGVKQFDYQGGLGAGLTYGPHTSFAVSIHSNGETQLIADKFSELCHQFVASNEFKFDSLAGGGQTPITIDNTAPKVLIVKKIGDTSSFCFVRDNSVSRKRIGNPMRANANTGIRVSIPDRCGDGTDVDFMVVCSDKLLEFFDMLLVVYGKFQSYLWRKVRNWFDIPIRHKESGPVIRCFRRFIKRIMIERKGPVGIMRSNFFNSRFAQDSPNSMVIRAVLFGDGDQGFSSKIFGYYRRIVHRCVKPFPPRNRVNPVSFQDSGNAITPHAKFFGDFLKVFPGLVQLDSKEIVNSFISHSLICYPDSMKMSTIIQAAA